MTIAEVMPNWNSNGLFVRLGQQIPWDTMGVSLDLAYIARSGDKTISPIVKKLLINNVIDDNALNSIVSALLVLYKNDWVRLQQALKEEYNPIENYAMVETTTPRVATTTTTSATNNIYGFNSNVGVPTNDADNTTRMEQEGENILERTGNIGVTTSQQMLESEYELRKKHYFEQVFRDVDNFLTLKIYD